MDELIRELKVKGVLRSPAIEAALRAVDRAQFVPKQLRPSAYIDEALPIGFGQTISQPYTVLFMLQKLDVHRGQAVLEIGYGSGWQTALLAHLVGERGRVYAVEIVSELCEFGKENVGHFSRLANRVTFFCQNAATDIPDVLFDRIIAAADVREVPTVWRERLKEGGTMLYPSRGSLVKEIKMPNGMWKVERYGGFVFVPFIG